MSNTQAIAACGDQPDLAARLAALALPPLAGKKFLNLGCGAGYFCGYAFFDAAARIVGVDSDAQALRRASKLFPACEFVRGNWNDLPQLVPDATFDLILCALGVQRGTALSVLVPDLMRRLAPGGLLVLETELVAAPAEADAVETSPGWYRLKGPDAAVLPGWTGIFAIFAPYAFKLMGESGAGVARVIIHARKPLPEAFLLLGAPGSGKTTAAKKLLPQAPHISGDSLLLSLKGRGGLLQKIAGENVSPCRLASVVRRICEQGGLSEYVGLVAEQAGGGDFVFEGYLPAEFREQFARLLAKEGFRPIRLELPPQEFSPGELATRARQEARKYQLFLEAYACRRRF